MPEYRRNRITGGTYFFTVNLLDRDRPLLVERIDILRQSVRRVRELMPFHIDAWVVLPEHMHALWTLPEGDADFPKRWQAIKMAFSKRVAPGETLSASRRSQGERGIWQRRYWEHTIRNDRDYATHVDYIHFNPVKHGLVSDVAAWPFSSFHKSVAMGHYPLAWAGEDDGVGDRGERS
jgi:putative transposase